MYKNVKGWFIHPSLPFCKLKCDFPDVYRRSASRFSHKLINNNFFLLLFRCHNKWKRLGKHLKYHYPVCRSRARPSLAFIRIVFRKTKVFLFPVLIVFANTDTLTYVHTRSRVQRTMFIRHRGRCHFAALVTCSCYWLVFFSLHTA